MKAIRTRATGIPRWGFLAVVWLLLAPQAACAESAMNSESVVKVALLYKLAQFVSWPPPEQAGPTSATTVSFRFCVLNEQSLDEALAALEGRSVGDRAIAVKRLRSGSNPNTCDLLFLGKAASASERWQILEQCRGRPILTISDSDGFAARGGMVEITKRRKRLAFRINLAATRDTGIRIAAPLLDLSTVVDR